MEKTIKHLGNLYNIAKTDGVKTALLCDVVDTFGRHPELAEAALGLDILTKILFGKHIFGKEMCLAIALSSYVTRPDMQVTYPQPKTSMMVK